MARKLLSVLGTGLYEPVIYRSENKEFNERKYEYIQERLIDEYLEKGDTLIIFLTDGSRKRNWEDRVYSKKDEQIFENFSCDYKIRKNECHIGLKNRLKKYEDEKGISIVDVTIPDGKTENEIWDVFTEMYNQIDEYDDIIFDITHSFRSLPMLALTVLNNAKVTKNINIEKISYGAYEALSLTENNNKVAPIFDLSTYNEMIELTYAAKTFMKFGNVDELKIIFNNDKKKKMKGEKLKIDVDIDIAADQMVDRLKDFSDSILTGRGFGKKNSIMEKHKVFKNEIKKKEDKLKGSKYEWILNKISKEYDEYNTSTDFETGMSTVRWCINNGATQLGFTALEESIKTFFCEISEADILNDRDTIVKSILVKADNNEYKKKCNDEGLYQEECIADIKINIKKDNISNYDEVYVNSIIDKMFSILNKDVIDKYNAIRNLRNNLNHFGYNSEGTAASTFIKELVNYNDYFIEYFKNVKVDEDNEDIK